MRLASLLSITSSLFSCSSVKIYDDDWCADAGKFGASCFSALGNREYDLNKYEWDKRRLGQVCSATVKPGLGYSHIKSALVKLCADTNVCSPEQKAAIEDIGKKIEDAVKSGAGSSSFDH